MTFVQRMIGAAKLDAATYENVEADQTAQPRPVEVGLRLPGMVEITRGLQGGEVVIIEGLQKVRPGGKVKPQPEATAPRLAAEAEAREPAGEVSR